MNTSRLQQLLDRYNPENDGGHGVTYAESLLLEAVIELAARVATLEAATRPAPAFAQPAFFPAGEDTPLFTQSDAPAEPCSRCNRRPEESGLARWQVCDVCGKPVCDTCAWNDPNGTGHYCSTECAFGADPDQ